MAKPTGRKGLAERLASDAGDGLAARVDAFLGAPLRELRARHGGAIAAAHAAHFDRRVVIFAPLYLASACLNDCAYCGFRRSARIARLKLSTAEALAEARCLAERGHRTLDLVTGEIPTDAFVAYVGEVTRLVLARTRVRRVNLNLGALSEEQYRHLRAAGATAYHLYQETYDEGVYLEVHRAGPKRDMANRLEASRRALRAGFPAIGLGVLLGLGPVRGDLIRLARHAQALLREFPAVRLGFSLPRIQAAGQRRDLLAAARVDDDTFAQALLFLRLEFPDAHLTLTTREGPALRDQLLRFGMTKVSAGVSTAPGGYTRARDRGTRQFSVRDKRSAAELARRIRAAGLVPTFA